MYRQLCLQSELTKQLQPDSKEKGFKQPTAKARMKPSPKMRPRPPACAPPGYEGDHQDDHQDNPQDDQQEPMQADAGGDMDLCGDMDLTPQEQAKNILAFNDDVVYEELYHFMKDGSDVG